MINLRDWVLHLLDPNYDQSHNTINLPGTDANGQKKQFKDIYKLKDSSKELKYLLKSLKSQTPNSRKLSFLVIALTINNFKTCASKDLLLLLKQCYHEDYIFFNLMSKTSLIRKKDLEIFKPSISKKMVVMNSMPLTQFPTGLYYEYDKSILEVLIKNNQFQRLPDPLTSLIWLDSTSISPTLMDFLRANMPFETLLNQGVDTPQSARSRALKKDTSLSIEEEKVIFEQPYDENVIGSSKFGLSSNRSSRMSRFSSRKNSKRDSINMTNRSKKESDDSGDIYKKSFIDKAMHAQMENKRRKSTFRFISINKKSRRGSIKKIRNSEKKSQSTKITIASNSQREKGLSHFASSKNISPKAAANFSPQHANHNIPVIQDFRNKEANPNGKSFLNKEPAKLSKFSRFGPRSNRKIQTNIESSHTIKVEVKERKCKTRIEQPGGHELENSPFLRRKNSRKISRGRSSKFSTLDQQDGGASRSKFAKVNNFKMNRRMSKSYDKDPSFTEVKNPNKRSKKGKRMTLFASSKNVSKDLPSLQDLRQSNTSFSKNFKKSIQRIEEMERNQNSQGSKKKRFDYQTAFRKSMIFEEEPFGSPFTRAQLDTAFNPPRKKKINLVTRSHKFRSIEDAGSSPLGVGRKSIVSPNRKRRKSKQHKTEFRVQSKNEVFQKRKSRSVDPRMAFQNTFSGLKQEGVTDKAQSSLQSRLLKKKSSSFYSGLSVEVNPFSSPNKKSAHKFSPLYAKEAESEVASLASPYLRKKRSNKITIPSLIEMSEYQSTLSRQYQKKATSSQLKKQSSGMTSDGESPIMSFPGQFNGLVIKAKPTKPAKSISPTKKKRAIYGDKRTGSGSNANNGGNFFMVGKSSKNSKPKKLKFNSKYSKKSKMMTSIDSFDNL